MTLRGSDFSVLKSTSEFSTRLCTVAAISAQDTSGSWMKRCRPFCFVVGQQCSCPFAHVSIAKLFVQLRRQKFEHSHSQLEIASVGIQMRSVADGFMKSASYISLHTGVCGMQASKHRSETPTFFHTNVSLRSMQQGHTHRQDRKQNSVKDFDATSKFSARTKCFSKLC